MIPTPPPDYRADIDGLRAVAILLVCIFHFKLLPIGEAGFIGVDVFFVISGFLITRILMRGLEDGTLTFSGFYAARLRRLMPAMTVTLVLYLAAAWWLFLPDRFAELSIEALLSQLYVVNVYFWRTINYFGLRAEQVPLLHMWSLAIEEQFYIIYPIVLATMLRLRRGLILPLVALGCLASFTLGWWATAWKPEATFYLLPTRAWELLAGGLLALLAPSALRGGLLASVVGAVGGILIAVALWLHTPVTPFPGSFAALPVLGAVFLILAGPGTPTGRFLALAPMVWIGTISYPLYLVHWPIIQLTDATTSEAAAWHGWAGFGLSILLAAAIWRFVEAPIRHSRAIASPRRAFFAAGSCVTLLIGVTLAGVLSDGFPNRFPAEARRYLAFAEDTPKPFFSCEANNAGMGPCALGRGDTASEVAVIGDSHAQALAGAFDLWLKQEGRSGELWFHHGCIPVLDMGPRRCPSFLERAISALTDDVDTVFLVSAWRHAPNVFGGVYLSAGEAADRALSERLELTIERLSATGRKIVLVEPMFAAPADVPERLAWNATRNTDLPLNQKRADHDRSYAALFDVFQDFEEKGKVHRLSLIEDLCRDGTCRTTLHGTPVFRDSNHLRFGLSDYFARQIDAAM